MSIFKVPTLLILWAFLSATTVSAHEVQPLIINVTERSSGQYVVITTLPLSLISQNTPKVIMPSACVKLNEESELFQCSQDLAGEKLQIAYPQSKPIITTLVRFYRLSGENTHTVLSPHESTWSFPAPETKISVAKQYTFMGIEHILGGIDHLLFLVGLLLIARTRQRILIAITGFTIAHSITLILSALNIVKLPLAPVEAVIALSIVFVATEIARGQKDTITYRHPSAVSCSFGLLHGFGFAAVLSEIGLPKKEVLTGLLFFNVGVEIGQLIFVGALVALMLVVRHFSSMGYAHIFARERAIAYGLGILASWWMIDRIVRAV